MAHGTILVPAKELSEMLKAWSAIVGTIFQQRATILELSAQYEKIPHKIEALKAQIEDIELNLSAPSAATRDVAAQRTVDLVDERRDADERLEVPGTTMDTVRLIIARKKAIDVEIHALESTVQRGYVPDLNKRERLANIGMRRADIKKQIARRADVLIRAWTVRHAMERAHDRLKEIIGVIQQ